GIACLTGNTASAENAVPYLAWRRIFSKLLKVDWPDITETSCQMASNLLQNWELGPLMNSVLPGLVEETSLVRGLSGRARTDATVNFLGEFIQSSAGESFVLILEDCHWMDSASWRLVERIAYRFPRALLVLTSRPHFESEELRVLRCLERFTE